MEKCLCRRGPRVHALVQPALQLDHGRNRTHRRSWAQRCSVVLTPGQTPRDPRPTALRGCEPKGSLLARVADPLQLQSSMPSKTLKPPPLPRLLLRALPFLELLQLVALLLGVAVVVAFVVREGRWGKVMRPALRLLQRCPSSVFSSLPSFLFSLFVFAGNFFHVFFLG